MRSKTGRKRAYSDDDIREHIYHLRENGYTKKKVNRSTGKVTRKQVKYKQTSLYNEVIRLKQFFIFLHGRDWEMPVTMPKVPDRDDMYQPMFSDENIEELILTTIIDLIPASWIVRLAAATIFGCRVSELGDIRVHLDGQNSSIYILTRKGGVRKHQPIPSSLVPIFTVGTEPMNGWKLQYILKSMCKKAEVELPEGAGWHAIRRRVVTAIYERTNAKDLPIINYFRWSTKQRYLSQLPTYVQSDTVESDRRILAQHPFVPIWEGVVPYLMQYHPEYNQSALARQAYNEIISHNRYCA